MNQKRVETCTLIRDVRLDFDIVSQTSPSCSHYAHLRDADSWTGVQLTVRGKQDCLLVKHCYDGIVIRVL